VRRAVGDVGRIADSAAYVRRGRHVDVRARDIGRQVAAAYPLKTAAEREHSVIRLTRLQQRVGVVLTRLFRESGPVRSVTLPGARTAGMHLQASSAGAIEAYVIVRKWPAAFWSAVAWLLERHGDQVRRCANTRCTQLFLKEGKALYCSDACSSGERSRRSYAKHRKTRVRQQRRYRLRKQTRTAQKGRLR
jgi:hypothetical protein